MYIHLYQQRVFEAAARAIAAPLQGSSHEIEARHFETRVSNPRTTACPNLKAPFESSMLQSLGQVFQIERLKTDRVPSSLCACAQEERSLKVGAPYPISIYLSIYLTIISLSLYISLSIYICIYIYMYMCMYVCMYVWMDGWMDVCIYIYIYMCVYIYIYIYIYICTHIHIHQVGAPMPQ